MGTFLRFTDFHKYHFIYTQTAKHCKKNSTFLKETGHPAVAIFLPSGRKVIVFGINFQKTLYIQNKGRINNHNRINMPSPRPQCSLFSLSFIQIFPTWSAVMADLFYWDGLVYYLNYNFFSI